MGERNTLVDFKLFFEELSFSSRFIKPKQNRKRTHG